MLTNAMGKTKVLFVSLAFQAGVSQSAVNPSKVVKVSGWPLNTAELPEALLSGDPLLGNLVCPALSRLNLVEQKSEPFLLQKIEVREDRWTFTLQKDLVWWDRQAVTSADLESFLRDAIPEAAKKQGLGRWNVPLFTFAQENGSLVLLWKSAPPFGPYVLNQSPFTKKADTQQRMLPFQCAGVLAPKRERDTLIFDSQGGKIKLAWNAASQESQLSPGESSVSFGFAEDLHPAGFKRQLDEAMVCEQALDTPLITLLAWNPQAPWARDARFRRAMTHLLPRGALLRSGAGSLGDLVSGPLMRLHPGYNEALKVPSYDPKTSDRLLNSLGLRRSEEDGYRRTPNGQLLELKILASDFEGSTILRKVLDDSFRALGLKTVFVQDSKDGVDGVLTSIASSWPDSNPILFLHSASARAPWPWRYSDADMDKALERYAASLTQEKPDFRLLEKVHELVYKAEPFSILMQHRVCLNAQLGKGRKSQQKVTLKNPDWFSDLTGIKAF